MRTTWLIEAGVYGDEISPLVAEIRRQGMGVGVIPNREVKRERK